MVALPPNFALLKRRKGTDRVVMLGEMARIIIDDSGNGFAIGEKGLLKMELGSDGFVSGESRVRRPLS